MTAVAAPLSFQHSNRIGWGSADGNAYGSQMDAEDMSKMFAGGPRKTVQRQNSSSSIASNASSTSTISATSAQTSNTSVSSGSVDGGSWAAKRKPSRGLWPSGKAEAATGLSTARPQAVTSSVSGANGSAAASSLHAPMLPSSQGTNGIMQNGQRLQAQNDPPAILHLLPINGTFERKTITVPLFPEVLRIGRQTNQKTLPTAQNGYFDSKVLSRQHAEVWADRQGRVFIRDVKSSNGTFVNGMRLSQENKESEPRELREQDVLELGIDIVSEDQKTVVHHKVAAKVEHAGVYYQGTDALNFGDLDPSSGGGLMAASQQLKRNGSQNSLNGRAPGTLAGHNMLNANIAGPQVQARNWLNPITTEHIIKKLNAEMKLAVQQSQDLARARQCIDALLSGKQLADKEPRAGSAERSRVSPTKAKSEFRAHFADPPAPPPQAPLPEKPDVPRLEVQPSLRRHDTARPMSGSDSPSHERRSEIVRLVEELESAKSEIFTQSERTRELENQLALEKTAREDAEKQIQQLESSKVAEPLISQEPPKSRSIFSSLTSSSPDLQGQINRLQATLDEMKLQMEAFKQRAITAENERDEARQSLAELVESKRAELANKTRSTSKSRKGRKRDVVSSIDTNGHAVTPHTPSPSSPTAVALLERAGLDEGQPITPEQAKLLTRLLSQEVLGNASFKAAGESNLMYHGRPLSAAALVVIFGVALMGWMNSWPRVER